MGINFDAMSPASGGNGNVIGETGTGNSLVLDLNKGAVLDLEKASPGLKNVTLGAAWDVAAAGDDFDLDIAAFLLHANGKIGTVDDIIYFNHMEGTGIRLNGDNRTGDGEGDDETIDVELDKIPHDIMSIVFTVNIYEASARRQTFGMVQSSKVRLINKDDGDKEICRFSLKDDYSSSTAVIFAKLIRDGGTWKFEAVGEGKVVNDLNGLVALYQ